MSLDVFILAHGAEPTEKQRRLALEDDGAYWYLEPFFAALHGETAKRVDLYGDASFHGATLLALSKQLGAAEAYLPGEPASWPYRETLLPRTGSRESDLATKAHVAGVVQALRSLVTEALELDATVLFVGD